MARDGNITGLPVTADDIRLAYRIYGPPPEFVKGRTVYKNISIDLQRHDSHTESKQSLIVDVIQVLGKKFLLGLATSTIDPLDLLVVVRVDDTKASTSSQALEDQVELLRSRGFNVKEIISDPESSLVSLPNVENTGAGDHTPKLDIKVRRLKEIIRSVVSSISWKIPSNLVQDLVSYAVNRMNTRKSHGSPSSESPRVKFTGRKIHYKREFCMSFGDYVECYDPVSRCNDVSRERTNSCIALYPCANITGSWYFFNLSTGRRVRRSRWKRMSYVPELISDKLRSLADRDAPIQTVEKGASADDRGVTDESLVHVEDRGVTDKSSVNVVEEGTDIKSTVSVDEEGGADIKSTESTVNVDDRSTGSKSIVNVEDKTDSNTGLRRSLRLKLKGQQIMRKHGGKALLNISVKRAMRSDPDHASNAIHEELQQILTGKKVFKPVKKESVPQSLILRSHMFLKYKYDAQGKLEKLKARLVADGRTQVRDNYPNRYSPTVSLEAIMATLKLAAVDHKHMAKFDVKGAYLNANIYEELYLELDPTITSIAVESFPHLKEFVTNGKLIVKLDKALYGLIQCARLWYINISTYLKELGFRQNTFDECVFTKGKLIVLLYVDDLLVTCQQHKHIRWLEKKLKERYQDVESTYGDKFTYLGMLLERTVDGSIKISMPQYIQEIITSKFYTKDYTTPADCHLFSNDPTATPLSPKEAKSFHSMVMKLMYLCRRVRSDALLPVLYLSTRVTSPSTDDVTKLQRIVGYIKRTPNRVKIISTKPIQRVEMYIDASFSTHEDGAGHSALVTMVGSTAAICKSSKQKLGTRNSTESELVALSDLYIVGLWIHEFLHSLGLSLEKPVIYQDNKSTVALVTSLINNKPRTRHLNARRRVMYDDIVVNKNVSIEYLPTDEMIADILSKPLQGNAFYKFAQRIQGN